MLLIDAYNVLRAQWALPERHRGMTIRTLVGVIGRSRYAGRRLRIVADGTPGPEFPAAVRSLSQDGLIWARLATGKPQAVGRARSHAEVVWSGRGREADDVIEEILADSHRPGAAALAVTVISSDRRLIRAASNAGATQLGNGAFLKQLAEDLDAGTPEPEPSFVQDVPLDPYSVGVWMREFGYAVPTKPSNAPTEPGLQAEEMPGSTTKPPADPTLESARESAAAKPSLETSAAPPEMEPPPRPEPSSPIEPLDPMLQRLFDEWSDRLDPADLEMSRWIDNVTPLRGPRPAP